MYDRRFWSSKLGLAAMASISAMIALNVLALNQQLGAAANTIAIASPIVGLA